MNPRHIVHVLTVADSLVFIDTLVRRSKERGFEVTIVTSPDARLQEFGTKNQVHTVGVDMPRKVTPRGDWGALSQLHRLLVSRRPGIVHAHTPKGGLLGSLAANAAQVPVRIYHMRGLPFMTLAGPMRMLLETTERVACSAATRVICQSQSLRAAALENSIVSAEKSEVVLQGSNGVDCDSRFLLSLHVKEGLHLREKLGISSDALVIGFVGRLVRDKGLPELAEAFERLSREHPDLWLVLAGGAEERDGIDEATHRRLSGHPRVRSLGHVKDPAGLYAAADIIVLPSHREGFPNVPLEAASMCRPVVSTLVPGCIDAVEDGRTGTLVRVNQPAELATALRRYISDGELRRSHGANGRLRVERYFRRDGLADATIDLYERELAAAGLD